MGDLIRKAGPVPLPAPPPPVRPPVQTPAPAPKPPTAPPVPSLAERQRACLLNSNYAQPIPKSDEITWAIGVAKADQINKLIVDICNSADPPPYVNLGFVPP